MHLLRARCADEPGKEPCRLEGTGSVRGSRLRGERMEYDLIGRLHFVVPVKGQGRAARPVRMGADPGILVGESPSLNRGASWILQTRTHHAPINLSLALQILYRSIAGGIDRQ